MPPGVLAMAAVFFAVFVCVCQMPFSNYIVHLIGILYPCYKSFEAIGSEEVGDDKQWLTYWMMFSLFNFIDTNL